MMPQTYSNRLNMILDERAQNFISELEQISFSDSGGLFNQFISDMEINSVELYNSSGDWGSLPTGDPPSTKFQGTIRTLGSADGTVDRFWPALQCCHNITLYDNV